MNANDIINIVTQAIFTGTVVFYVRKLHRRVSELENEVHVMQGKVQAHRDKIINISVKVRLLAKVISHMKDALKAKQKGESNGRN